MQPEQPSGSESPPGGERDSRNDSLKRLGSAAKESAEEYLLSGWRKPFYKWIQDEWSGVKAGRILFIVLALLIFAGSAWLVHKYDSTKKHTEIQSLTSHNAISNAFLLGTIAQNERDKRTSETTILSLKSDIIRLTTEKTSAENRAALFEAIPLQVPSIITNLSNLIASQPTNQQQLLTLLDTVQSLTNSLTEAALRPAFELYVNDIKLTDGMMIDLRQSRVMRIAVKNTSTMTAEQLGADVMFLDLIDPTNVNAPGWNLGPADTHVHFGYGYSSGQTKEVNATITNAWTWQANRLVTGSVGYQSFYHLPTITISTNLPNITKDTLLPVVMVRFIIYAARAKTSTYNVSLVFY